VKRLEYYVTEEEGLRNLFTQVLTGDRTDNIIGLKGIGPVKAEKLLKDCKTEREYYDACLKAYSEAGLTEERVIENLNLLYLRRKENDKWQLPIEK
jgi:5'-3' exonuclease